VWDSGTLIAFYNPQSPSLFSLNQSLSDLELRSGTRLQVYLAGALRRLAPIFITITSGAQGTAIYVDGALAEKMPDVQSPAHDVSGEIVLGDSPRQSRTWRGQIFGIAVYYCDLAAPQVLRHFRTWTQYGRPQIADDEDNVALYLFDEHTGNVVHNRSVAGADLHIPERYVVVDQAFLEPIWKEFEISPSYWVNALKNIVGFVPLGFCFYSYFLSSGIKTPALFTVVFGTLVSLTIEVLQSYLPTRDSGTTDLVTNTLGTWLGVASSRLLVRVRCRFPWLDWSVVRK